MQLTDGELPFAASRSLSESQSLDVERQRCYLVPEAAHRVDQTLVGGPVSTQGPAVGSTKKS